MKLRHIFIEHINIPSVNLLGTIVKQGNNNFVSKPHFFLAIKQVHIFLHQPKSFTGGYKNGIKFGEWQENSLDCDQSEPSF